MATNDKLYELISEKLRDWFTSGKSSEDLPPEVKAAAKKDPKLQKQMKKLKQAEDELEKGLDRSLDLLK